MTASVGTSRRGRSDSATRPRRKGGAPLVLSMKEIERRYDGEWVLIVNPIVDKLMRVVRGELVYHSKERDEVDRVMLQRRDKSTAMLCIGPFPPDFVAVL